MKALLIVRNRENAVRVCQFCHELPIDESEEEVFIRWQNYFKQFVLDKSKMKLLEQKVDSITMDNKVYRTILSNSAKDKAYFDLWVSSGIYVLDSIISHKLDNVKLPNNTTEMSNLLFAPNRFEISFEDRIATINQGTREIEKIVLPVTVINVASNKRNSLW